MKIGRLRTVGAKKKVPSQTPKGPWLGAFLRSVKSVHRIHRSVYVRKLPEIGVRNGRKYFRNISMKYFGWKSAPGPNNSCGKRSGPTKREDRKSQIPKAC